MSPLVVVVNAAADADAADGGGVEVEGAAEWMRKPTNASSVALGPRSSTTRRCSISGKKPAEVALQRVMLCKSNMESWN
jgi:hypothetical protein